MSNVTKHPSGKLASILRQFLQKPDPQLLFAAIRLSSKHRLSFRSIDEAYRALDKNMWDETNADELANFFTLHGWSIKRPDAVPSALESQFTERMLTSSKMSATELNQGRNLASDSQKSLPQMTLDDVASALLTNAVDSIGKAANPNNPFGAFRAAWETETIFSHLSKELNPLLVIGKYYKSMFQPEQLPAMSPETILIGADEVSFITTMIADFANTLISRQPKPEESTVPTNTYAATKVYLILSRALSNPGDPPGQNDRTTIFEFLSEMLTASQSIFDLFIVLWSKDEVAELHDEDAIKYFTSLLDDGLKDDHSRRSCLGQMLPQIKLPKSQIPMVRWPLASDLFDRIFASDFIPNSETKTACYASWLAAASSVARNSADGRFPIAASGLGDFFNRWRGDFDMQSIYELNVSDIPTRLDIRVLLEFFEASGPYSAFGLAQYFWDGEWERLDNRASYFTYFVELALSQGFDELANAFLAFGLVTQAALGGPKLGFRKDELSSLLFRIRQRPGSEYVETALPIVIAHIEKLHPASLEAIWLRSFAPRSTPEGTIPDRMPGLSRKQIEAQLQADIGKREWLCLSIQTRSLLTDAEKQYSNNFIELGKGIENWGAMALAYLKAIEHELVLLFNPVATNPILLEYKMKNGNRGELTLGSITHLIRNFAKLPSEVRVLIESMGYGFEGDSNFASILRAATDLRNAAAHPKNFGIGEFEQVRQLLFRDLLITRIARASSKNP